MPAPPAEGAAEQHRDTSRRSSTSFGSTPSRKVHTAQAVT